jgi:hypothetical protein
LSLVLFFSYGNVQKGVVVAVLEEVDRHVRCRQGLEFFKVLVVHGSE